jgi:histolysain
MFFLLVASALAINFEQWSIKHGKVFSRAEGLRRKAIFASNLAYAEDFNKANSFTLSVEGPWAAMTNDEYRSLLTLQPTNMRIHVVNAAPRAIPEEYSFKDKMPAVRDQAQCGSCWAFSILQAMEGHMIHAGVADAKIDLSEQQLVDCDTLANGCAGGQLDITYYYIQRNGVMDEKDYPYKAVDQVCMYDSKKIVATVDGLTQIPQQDEDAMAQAVYEGGAIACSLDAGQIAFSLYTSGVYTDSRCSKRLPNHGIGFVGYGVLNNVKYFWLRNSWGASWGQAGYMQIRRGTNECGLSNDCCFGTNAHWVK